MTIPQINTKEEARDFAIEWQKWAGEQNLSYAEAERFDLTEEFTENGIL